MFKGSDIVNGVLGVGDSDYGKGRRGGEWGKGKGVESSEKGEGGRG